MAVASDFPGVTVAEGVEGFDVIVNATPVGLTVGSNPEEIGFGGGVPVGLSLFVDLVYSSGGTELQHLVRSAGIPTVDGLEILVRQGALSIEIWTGLRPGLDVLREAVSDSQG
jgi:shikimate dehydrogenase